MVAGDSLMVTDLAGFDMIERLEKCPGFPDVTEGPGVSEFSCLVVSQLIRSQLVLRGELMT
jgi:hypothetical protein